MDNSRSLEAIYQDGTGMVSLPKKSFKASIEGYDGFDDMLSAELAHSEENLAFLDAFQMVEAKNAADTIKMLKKINANYGTRSGIPAAAATSVESLCNILSLEAEETAEANAVDTKDEKAKTPESTAKKAGFFKTIFNAIARFFKGIANLFRKFVGIFQKKAVEETNEGPDTVNANLNNGDEASSSSGSTNAASLNLKKLNGKPLDIRSLKVEKMGGVINQYEQIAAAAKKLTNIPDIMNDSAQQSYINTSSDVRKRNAQLMSNFGFKVSTSDFSVDTKKATTFDKFYKMAEKQISKSDDDTYATVLKNLCNISVIDEKQWADLASKKQMKCDKVALQNLGKFADRFAKTADEYASIATELANKVDSSLSKRTVKTTTEGTNGKTYEDRKWSNNNGSMNSSEVCLSSTAAMLKFSSKVGKLVMDIYTRIASTVDAAKKVRAAGNAAREAANKAARDATKTAKNV